MVTGVITLTKLLLCLPITYHLFKLYSAFSLNFLTIQSFIPQALSYVFRQTQSLMVIKLSLAIPILCCACNYINADVFLIMNRLPPNGTLGENT